MKRKNEKKKQEDSENICEMKSDKIPERKSQRKESAFSIFLRSKKM